MIFRNADGNLIIINKNDYINDVVYYEKIIKLYKNKKYNLTQSNTNNTNNNYLTKYSHNIINQLIDNK
jgi:hypothetical protein